MITTLIKITQLFFYSNQIWKLFKFSLTVQIVYQRGDDNYLAYIKWLLLYHVQSYQKIYVNSVKEF